MKINCHTFNLWYPPYLNGGLSKDVSELAGEHLNSCLSCKAAADKIENLIEKKLHPSEDPFFYTRLVARLDKGRINWRSSILRPALAYTLVLALSLSMGISLGVYFHSTITTQSLYLSSEDDYVINSDVSELDLIFCDETL